MFEAQAYGYKGIDSNDRQGRMRIITNDTFTNDTNSSSPRGNLHVQTRPHFTLRRQPYTERTGV